MILNPDAALAPAVFSRHSIRSFRDSDPGERIINALRSEISYAVSRDAAIHFQLKLNDATPFKGFKASYGMFHNPRHYVACVVDTSYDNCLQRAGFWAEMLVLKAVSLGLGTCFVGGTFNHKKVTAQTRITWSLPFIVLFGKPEESRTPLRTRVLKHIIRSDHKPELGKILAPGSLSIEEISTKYPCLLEPLQAVNMAPSSMNRRPVRIKITSDPSKDNPVVSACCVKNYEHNDIDLGISLANWQACAGGEWEFGQYPLWIQP